MEIYKNEIRKRRFMVKKNSTTLWYPPLKSFKSYIDCISELSSDEAFDGLLGFGLFAESLPPLFTAEYFLDYCKNSKPSFKQGLANYIRYESMRNTNTVRLFGIPTPFTHYHLCLQIRDNWSALLTHFSDQTKSQSHKISRIHVRKQYNTKCIFKMNYQSWRKDETPSTDLSIGSRYLVHADISTCFPSIYTHCIPWALLTKPVAKTNKTTGWANELDKYTRWTTNGETHGILIGPHTSNLLSEIILTSIDRELHSDNFSYLRHIDDFDCYVESYERGEEFIVTLRRRLKEYSLSLNDKKTNFEPLPVAEEKNWKNRLGYEQPISVNGEVNYRQLQRFLDLATSLLTSNDENLAILKYAMKMVSGFPLNSGAVILAQKYFLHMAAIYPYLIPDLEEFVFTGLKTNPVIIGDWCNEFFKDFLISSRYEAVAYLLYFATIYVFSIHGFDETQLIDIPDCIVKTVGSIYFNNLKSKNFNDIYDDAKGVYKDEDLRNQYWLYCYSTLTQNDLSGDWQKIKKDGVSFIV